MTISNMDVPDAVANAARDAFEELDGPLLYGYKAAIRAALQALVDTGRAKYFEQHYHVDRALPGPVLIIRLDSDERKPEEQR